MDNTDSKTIVVSLGGSLVVPGDIDVSFLKSFKSFIEDEIKNGYRFLIIVGGGKTARHYQDALSEIIQADSTNLDWLGIGALRLNAMLVRSVFGDLAYGEVVNNGPDEIGGIDKPLIICGAQKPGSSTDYGSVLFANKIGATRIVNLSNINKVYTSDPRTNPDAKAIDDITWTEFRKIIPDEWKPGLSSPFDPVAAKAAQESNIQVAIINGANLDNLKKFIEGEPFDGTLIHN
jgi:uridylate kinase